VNVEEMMLEKTYWTIEEGAVLVAVCFAHMARYLDVVA
jgi:hypothetical protein